MYFEKLSENEKDGIIYDSLGKKFGILNKMYSLYSFKNAKNIAKGYHEALDVDVLIFDIKNNHFVVSDYFVYVQDLKYGKDRHMDFYRLPSLLYKKFGEDYFKNYYKYFTKSFGETPEENLKMLLTNHSYGLIVEQEGRQNN